MHKNHHAFESKVAAVQVAQVNRVARERPDGLRVVHRTALQAALRARAHAAKDADLKAVRRVKDHTAKDADLKAALRAKDHAAKDADLKAALRAKDHGAKAQAARDADLKGVRRTVLQESLALKAQAEKDPAEKECGVRIPNDSSSGPWNSIVMAMASSIATS